MNSMRFCKIVALWLLWGAVISVGVLGAPPADVVQAAATGWPDMLARIPAGEWGDYGFLDSRETAQATLGAPMPVYTITPAALDGYQPGAAIDSLLSETSLWYVPVVVGGAVRAILVVDRLEDKWQAVSLGYVPLAGPLGRVLAQWPESEGYHPRLVMVFQAQQYLFTIPEWSEPNLTPLSGRGMDSAAKAGPIAVGRLGETVAVLKPIVARQLSGR